MVFWLTSFAKVNNAFTEELVILPKLPDNVTGIANKCKFPFEYKNNKYQECLVDKEENTTSWCLGEGKLKWHPCSSTCPTSMLSFLADCIGINYYDAIFNIYIRPTKE